MKQSGIMLPHGIWPNSPNYMWGKLTDRNDRTMTKIITKPTELYGFLSTPGIEVMNLVFASDDEN